MSLTQIAVALVGVYLILVSQTAVSAVLTLILGIVVVVLVILDSGVLRR